MKSSIKFKTTTSSLLVFFAFGCFAFCPLAQAVLPPPDGGYPGFNTAEGQNALFNLTTGVGNAAVGWFSLFSDTDGSFNTAMGAGTLLFNVGDQATGEGTQNTAVGTAALLFNTTGAQNTATGGQALFSNKSGGGNTATGFQALHDEHFGSFNTATGYQALFSNSGNGIDGIFNTANGTRALFHNVAGSFNTATGNSALENNRNADRNTATGDGALQNTTGSGNIALGANAGSNLTVSSDNIDIGNAGVAEESGTIRIGTAPTQTRTFIAGINNSPLSGGAVVVNGAGQLGVQISSTRFKDEIKPMGKASEALFALKPVTFRYKKEIDPQGTPQFGLVAEEVEKVNPDLILRDQEGKPYTVRYEQINAMLLNEFLKEHKKVEEQGRKIREQKAAINRLGTTVETALARIKEHELKTRRVNEQNEVNQVATRRIRRAGPRLHIVTND
jgi:Chaperone of endosialidase